MEAEADEDSRAMLAEEAEESLDDIRNVSPNSYVTTTSRSLSLSPIDSSLQGTTTTRTLI